MGNCATIVLDDSTYYAPGRAHQNDNTKVKVSGIDKVIAGNWKPF